jgi:hypothetical protein
MIKKTSLLLHIALFVCLIGCQSNSKKDCATINWRSDGEALALSGESIEPYFKELSLRCKKFVSSGEINAFNEGYNRGLAKLCTTQSGYDYGASGKDYKDTCPDYRVSNFQKGYYKGRLEFLVSRQKEIEDLYNSSEERVWRKEREYTIILNQDPQRAKLEADVLESYREEARSLALLSVNLKKEILKTKRLSAESFF